MDSPPRERLGGTSRSSGAPPSYAAAVDLLDASLVDVPAVRAPVKEAAYTDVR